MATVQRNVLRHLHRAALLHGEGGPTDGELLAVFIARRDEAAFEALLRRHGPMVLGVCRRLLGNEADAEDAFQATFLVLARKASAVVPRERVGNWLHGVARRTALKARTSNARRRARERQAQLRRVEAHEEAGWPDLQHVLDQELARLPDKYRAPLVLCDLEGKARKEAARHLGWPEGTVATRLARARVLLAKGLARHGLMLSGGAVGAVLAPGSASASLPLALVRATVKAATSVAAGQAAAGVISGQVAALTDGMLRTLAMIRRQLVTAALVALAAIGLAGGVVVCWRPAAAENAKAVAQGQRKENGRRPGGRAGGATLAAGTAPRGGLPPAPLPPGKNAWPGPAASIHVPPRAPYTEVFATARKTVGAFFEIAYANAYDGRIESRPAPARWGERWLAFLGVRHRVALSITVADQGGYWVELKVYRERCVGGVKPKGAAVWKPAGRAPALERVLLWWLARRLGKTALVRPRMERMSPDRSSSTRRRW
jgi:RNA polymerase sigma factor (sigma-70 family)